MSKAELKAGGFIYRGWKDMQVQRGIEQAAGAFVLSLTEKWPGQPDEWPMEPGEVCSVLLDDAPVITGYVDASERSFDAHSHAVKVTGRDKAADIIDCSALLPGDKTSSMKNKTLLQVASTLCEPYKITVTDVAVVTDLLKGLSIEPYETVWENIERYARQKAVLIISDGKGGLVITRAGSTVNPTPLVEGKNIISAKFVRDNSQRYSRYIIRGQDAGADDVPTAQFTEPEATESDDAIKRNRTLLFAPEDLAQTVTMRDRVKWERNIRRARSRRVVVMVQGWSANGRVWQPNEMVAVKIPTLGIEGRLLIVSVTYTLDGNGSRTELVLSPKEAYELLPEAAEQAAGGLDVSPDTLELLK